MIELRSIEEEAAACRAAFEAAPDAEWAWHREHDVLFDPAADWADRIEVILTVKPEPERALRLRLFRPTPPALAAAWAAYASAPLQAVYDAARASGRPAWDEAYAPLREAMAAYHVAVAAAHATTCDPDCPWNGWAIFAEGA
jgi:hypothetical protein